MKFRSNIKHLISASGLGQNAIARQAGIPNSTMSRLVNKETDMVNIKHLMRLCSLFGISMDDLFYSDCSAYGVVLKFEQQDAA